MSVPAAYVAVITIWSATPLGLVWSSESLTPVMAAFMRMTIAAVVGWFALKAMKIVLPWHGRALKVYSFSVIGVFLGMILSYIGATTVPSGVISVMFAMSPIISGILAYLIIKDRSLNVLGIVGFVIALLGIAMIFLQDGPGTLGAIEGLWMVLLSVLLFCLSGVLVKGTGSDIHPMAITVGTLILSVPCYAASWVVLDGSIPVIDWSTKSPWAVLIMALLGSLIGFGSYFYVLQKMSPTAVTTVTLITPIFALILGAQLNDEVLGAQVFVGALFVLLGLSIYILSPIVMRIVPAEYKSKLS